MKLTGADDRRFVLLAVAAIAGLAFVLDIPAFHIGLLSDAWVVLGTSQESWVAPIGQHRIPLLNLTTSAMWKVFGTHGARYQGLNLLLFAGVACLVFRAGRSILGRSGPALLAALLFVSSATYYEVYCWPVIGNMNSLATGLAVLALLAARQSALGKSTGWSWTFAGLALAAFWTYELTAPTLVAGGVWILLGRWRSEDSWRQKIRASWARLLPAGCALFAILAVRWAWPNPVLDTASLLDYPLFRFGLAIRGALGLLTLRGSETALTFLQSFGSQAPFPTRLHNAANLAWFALLIGGSLWLWWRDRLTGMRWLLSWFWIQLAISAVATGVVSRHLYLPAIPALLILARLLFAGAESSRARAILGNRASVAPWVIGLTLALGAQTERTEAVDLHVRATAELRRLEALLRERSAEEPPLKQVVILGLPAILRHQGIAAHIAINGTYDLVRLVLGPQVTTHLGHFLLPNTPGYQPGGSQPYGPANLEPWLADPQTLVLQYREGLEAERSVRRLTATSWRFPDRYTEESSEWLPWSAGVLRLPPGRDWPFRFSGCGSEPWMAIAYHDLGGSGPQASWAGTGWVAPPAPATGALRVGVFALPGSGPDPVVALSTAGDSAIRGLWCFSPVTRYTPASAPYLPWRAGMEPAFPLSGQMTLPLRVSAGVPIRIAVLQDPGGPPPTIQVDGRFLDPSPHQGRVGRIEYDTIPASTGVVAVSISSPTARTLWVSSVEAPDVN